MTTPFPVIAVPYTDGRGRFRLIPYDYTGSLGAFKNVYPNPTAPVLYTITKTGHEISTVRWLDTRLLSYKFETMVFKDGVSLGKLNTQDKKTAKKAHRIAETKYGQRLIRIRGERRLPEALRVRRAMLENFAPDTKWFC